VGDDRGVATAPPRRPWADGENDRLRLVRSVARRWPICSAVSGAPVREQRAIPRATAGTGVECWASSGRVSESWVDIGPSRPSCLWTAVQNVLFVGLADDRAGPHERSVYRGMSRPTPATRRSIRRSSVARWRLRSVELLGGAARGRAARRHNGARRVGAARGAHPRGRVQRAPCRVKPAGAVPGLWARARWLPSTELLGSGRCGTPEDAMPYGRLE
jgi:hypothetical protein